METALKLTMLPLSTKLTRNRNHSTGIIWKSNFLRIRFSITGSMTGAASATVEEVGEGAAFTSALGFSAMEAKSVKKLYDSRRAVIQLLPGIEDQVEWHRKRLAGILKGSSQESLQKD